MSYPVPDVEVGTATVRLAARGEGFSFVDLGRGPAGTSLSLAPRLPEAQFLGVETAPLSHPIARLRTVGRSNCPLRSAHTGPTDSPAFD